MINLKEYFIAPSEPKIKKNEFQPASYFRKEFFIEKEIQKAEVYITACGMYQGYLNDEAISNQVFTPGFTYYVKRMQYQTFNVTSLLKKGSNVLGVIVGDG